VTGITTGIPFAQALAEARAQRDTIHGHPSKTLLDDQERTQQITVCGECGRMRTILWMIGDIWYCRNCKHTGMKRPTQIALTGRRKHRHG